jgi:hypothetical protein
MLSADTLDMSSTTLPLRTLAAAAVAISLIVGAPLGAQARYGPQEERLLMKSGDSGWLGENQTTLTRRVHPGNGVVFYLHARMHGMPESQPAVVGCSSSHGVDVRYIWDRAEHDFDITKAIADGGWRRPGHTQLDWRFRLRVVFRVGAATSVGSHLDCPIRINIERRHAVIDVV